MLNIFSNVVFLNILEVILLVALGFLVYEVVNVTKLRKNRAVTKQAYTDQLTGRGNRYLFLSVLDDLIKKGKKFAVCFMDLDGFKQINDTMGHDAGDELLVYLARTFENKLPSNAVAYRLGGDEFAIVIQNIKTTNDVTKILDYMKEQFEIPVNIQGTNISLEYSLGVSIFPIDSDNKQDLIKYADDAMYYIKEHGKNGYYFHNKTLKAKLENKNKMEKDLKEAYEKGEFAVSLQPRLDLVNKDVVCFEATVYWNHPVLGRLNAEYFIKQADEMGIIMKLDYYVLNTVCNMLKKLKELGFKKVQMAVNISNRHAMKKDFIDKICQILEENGIQKDELFIEITNNIEIEKISSYKQLFDRLKSIGVGIIINNFSIKYEDLELFNELSVDEIKISSNYICKNSTLNKDTMKNVVELSKELGYKVIVGRIEEKYQLEEVLKYGVHKIQGNLLFDKMYYNYINQVVDEYDKSKDRIKKIIEAAKK